MMKKIIPLLLTLSVFLSSCASFAGVPNGDNNASDGGTTGGNGIGNIINNIFGGDGEDTAPDPSASSAPASVDFAQNDSDMFTDRDRRVTYDEQNAILIQLNGDTAAASDKSVNISGSTVTITAEGTYVITGTLTNGMLIVNAEDTAKLQLVFDGVNIHSDTSAPLYILEADKVFVTLKDGTSNTLSSGESYVAIDENNIDAAVFSKQDLTFNGTGSLTVTAPAGHGIVSKDDLVITGGTYTVTGASHGLDANDSIRITDAAVTVDAGKDGIHAENNDDATLGFVYISGGTFDIDAEGDGISAGATVQIEDGTFDIVSGGGSVNASKASSDSWGGFMGGKPGGRPSSSSSSDTEDSSTGIKGIKSAGEMLISGGTFTIDSADDSIHTNASVTVNGGTFTIASGDDAFHADETLTVTAGNINITKSYEGLEGLHIAVSGGDIKLVASDDGLNAAGGTDSSGFGGSRGGDMFGGRGMGGGMGGSGGGSIVISGGTLYIEASGDGIDANGTLEITGGFTTVCGPTQGDTATLDYDVSSVITGGTFIGTGAANMAQTFSGSEQGVISIRVGNQSAGTQITLTDAQGNVLVSYTPALSFAIVIISTPDMVSGQEYTVTVGSSSGTFAAE